MFKIRLSILAAMLALPFMAMLCRLWQLQISGHEKYLKMAEANQGLKIESAARGAIYDRNGAVLAENRPVYDIALRLERLKLHNAAVKNEVRAARERFERDKAKDPLAKEVWEHEFTRIVQLLRQEPFVKNLAHTLKREDAEVADGLFKALDTVAKKWASPHDALRIAGDVDKKVWLTLQTTQNDVFRDPHQLFGHDVQGAPEPPFPGLVCTLSTQRVYPQGRLACFALGAVGELTSEDEKTLEEDGILLENSQARHKYWTELHDSFNDGRAAGLENILHTNLQDLQTLADFYKALSTVKPSETALEWGLAEPLRWLDRPPRIMLSEAESFWLGVGVPQKNHTMLPDAIIGELGIERYYNDWLRGKHGLRMRGDSETSSDDEAALPVRKTAKRDGQPLALTLSLPWQHAVEKALHSQDRPGAAIVMDINNGEILALASWPDFDPNTFSPPREGTQRQEQLRAIFNDPNKPLLNRALSEQYPLGSCMKALIAAVALEKKVVNTQDVFQCPGYYTVGKQVFHCDDSRSHGSVNLLKAIRCSCNVTFFQIGSRLGSVAESTAPWAKRFFGRPTGIDLPGEVSGFFPDRASRVKAFPHNAAAQAFPTGLDLQLAIGQGMFSCTPLQALVMMGAIANGGHVVQPHLWLNQQAPPQPLGISVASLEVVKEGLCEVVNTNTPGERGTAYSAFHELGALAVSVAGKTSSAEHKKGAKPHAWFIGYTPAENPQQIFAVMLEEAGHGGDKAAPLAYKFLREIYGTRAAPVKNPAGE
jgi:cell division protein FtsI/penicillin-binding protein 2